MGALNLPSAADVERLTRRVRSVSQRLEGIEDGVDRLDERLAGAVDRDHRARAIASRRSRSSCEADRGATSRSCPTRRTRRHAAAAREPHGAPAERLRRSRRERRERRAPEPHARVRDRLGVEALVAARDDREKRRRADAAPARATASTAAVSRSRRARRARPLARSRAPVVEEVARDDRARAVGVRRELGGQGLVAGHALRRAERAARPVARR